MPEVLTPQKCTDVKMSYSSGRLKPKHINRVRDRAGLPAAGDEHDRGPPWRRSGQLLRGRAGHRQVAQEGGGGRGQGAGRSAAQPATGLPARQQGTNLNDSQCGFLEFDAELLALKHKSRILGHSSDPVSGFSMMEQVDSVLFSPWRTGLALL